MTLSWPGKKVGAKVCQAEEKVTEVRMGDTARYILKTVKGSVKLKPQVTMARKETREVKMVQIMKGLVTY